jgi:hypothetical protein
VLWIGVLEKAGLGSRRRGGAFGCRRWRRTSERGAVHAISCAPHENVKSLTSSKQSWSWVSRSAMVTLIYAASYADRDEGVLRLLMWSCR